VSSVLLLYFHNSHGLQNFTINLLTRWQIGSIIHTYTKKGAKMKTFLIQITREFEIEVEATDEAEALEVALERVEDEFTETITVDELAD